jgi:hypothetical protein
VIGVTVFNFFAHNKGAQFGTAMHGMTYYSDECLYFEVDHFMGFMPGSRTEERGAASAPMDQFQLPALVVLSQCRHVTDVYQIFNDIIVLVVACHRFCNLANFNL